MISIAPTLAEMASYPFVRLEEARRRLVAQGIDVIDFGKGDPNEPTDPMIRQALIDALPERSPYPLAQGLPELRNAVANWCARRFGVTLDPDTEIIPTYGSKEAIFSLAQVLVDPHSEKRCVTYCEPAYPVYERGALFAGAEVQHAAAAARERLPPGSRRRRRRHVAAHGDRVGELPEQPDRRARAARVLRAARRARRAIRLRDRLRRGVHRALVRRAARVGAAGRRPLARDRLPDAEQALVDDGLPLRASSPRRRR